MPPPPPGSAAAGDGTGALSRVAIIGAAETGSQLLEIEGYSHTREQLPTGCAVTLPPFSVGGHSWQLAYYPNNEIPDYADFITISVARLPEPEPGSAAAAAGGVRARVSLSLLDQAGDPVPSRTRTTTPLDFSWTAGVSFHDFINRAWLEQSEYLVDDRLTIRCDVEVTLVRTEETPPMVTVPPPDLHQHLGALLATKEGADVTFQVAGETLCAHRCVLAARSPVFKAELFGAMKEGTNTAVVRVDDMEADVFRALLHFVYTDTLDDCNWHGDGVKQQKEAAMAQHLLVAADRYNLERLKLICEEKLLKHIDADSVTAFLVLAEQHNCSGLKKACLQFLRSPTVLSDVMATEGFEHLARSCPSVLELMFSVLTRASVDLGEASQVDMGCRGMFSSGRRTKYWFQALVLLVLFLALLYLKGGNTRIACVELLHFFMGTIIH
ncbi:unnamed protein product [Urochloa decumbens]|uniref:Uncharacterized protein n=1 Tax=Urochloa decumbens TaxID=240449 RepID=A0ABC8YFU4_9POAL